MAKRLEELIRDTYREGDTIELSQGGTGVINKIVYNEQGTIYQLIVTDDKGKKHTVSIE